MSADRSALEARPPAKVNLTLEVTGRRPDGYHDLWSVFLRIGLTDRLTIRPADRSDDRLAVGGLPGAPVQGNLVLKSLAALRAHAGPDLPPLDVTLDKQIPAAGGLGGGSSDAASTLEMAQAAWGISLPAADRLELAAALGSDVPFFASGQPAAVIEGRGERMEPLPAVSGTCGLLLVTAPTQIPTGAAFEYLDQLGGGRATRMTGQLLTEFASGITGSRLAEWAEHLRDANGLWPAAAALAPILPELRDRLELASGRPWLLSGSGPTLFAIYASVNEAADAGRALVDGSPREVASLMINAVDLTGPDPTWRHP
jgi:4-diphosphocytidyl-2-C-methyl-D-erythritol kinase